MKPTDMIANTTTHLEGSGIKIYKQSDLANILHFLKEETLLPSRMTLQAFKEMIINELNMNMVSLSFPGRKETRYLWKNPSDFQVALSLKQKSFLCYQTAAYLHHLTEKPALNIYLNTEQPLKRLPAGTLTQERIDLAFANQPRITKYKAKYEAKTIWIISGMYTGQYGVISMALEDGENLMVTNIEKTLIDISIRPIYGGGAEEVLKAYRLAKGKFLIDRLVDTLKMMKYVYPFHQVIGFYLDQAGGTRRIIRHRFLNLE
jgi:hypothetical protein